MDFEWVAIALGDVTWIVLAFLFGFLARLVNLPPMVGFLVTGFVLNYFGFTSGETLQKLADLGITLLLFAVGLKLKPKVLIKPHVWSVTLIHISLVVGLFGAAIFGLSQFNIPLFSELDLKFSLMVAFALSFSSTVFVVKVLEEKGDMNSLHGRIAIGILVMQDLAAVIFLAASSGKIPSHWALLLFLLIPMRPIFHKILQHAGHGELLILYALVLALGGAELFELGGVKDDLGALFMGVLISTHPKAKEMAKAMLSFKDLFLVGFFLTIGMSGQLTIETLLIGSLLVPFMFIKSAMFFALMTRFNLRARTSLIATINLTNYSEFGLIVAAIGVSSGWISGEWLVIIAIALSISFIISAPLNRQDNKIYSQYRKFWLSFQSETRLNDDQLLDTHCAKIAIFGMGRVGAGAYDKMEELHGKTVIGIDVAGEIIKYHHDLGRNVLRGDPSDPDFWDNINRDHVIDLVMITLPNLQSNIDVIEQLKQSGYKGKIAATARYKDEEDTLKELGVCTIFNMYSQAGQSFANHVHMAPISLARTNDRRKNYR